MIRAATRRDFLQTLLAGGAAALAVRPVAGQSPAPHVAVTPLGNHLLLVTVAGSNVVAGVDPEGLLLVNGGSRAHASALGAGIAAEFGSTPVKTLFNTDWHPEHTGSNEAVRKAGGTVIAHEYTKQYLQRAGLKTGLPTKTFYTSGTMTFGDETIEYGQLGQAHTDGDIYVFFKSANVLVVGDMMAVGAYPLADADSGGWLGGMATATKTLLDLTNEQTKVIPGAGPAQTRAALDAQHKMLAAVRERFAKMMRQGMSADDMLAAGITKDFDAVWGDPKTFITAGYRGMWLHFRELGGGII